MNILRQIAGWSVFCLSISVPAWGMAGNDWETNSHSAVYSSSETTASSINIASTDYVGVGTATVTLKGNRPVLVQIFVAVDNGSGGARTYTIAATEDGEVITGHEHPVRCVSGEAATMTFWHFHVDGESAGEHNFGIFAKTNNATGTQTITDFHILVKEDPEIY